MPRLTKTLVEATKPTPRRQFIWDTNPKGFGLQIMPSGTKTFLLQYRSAEGKTKRYTIGQVSDTLTVEQARRIAKDKYTDILNGHDPMGEKKARRNALTVGELLGMYMASERFKGNAPSTQSVDRGRVNRHLLPLLGGEFVDNLTADQVERAHRAIKEGKTAARVKTVARGVAKVRGGPGAADKSILLLSAAYGWAMKNKLARANPTTAMKYSSPGQRDTIIEDTETYSRLFRVLDQMQNEKRIREAVADAIRVIALTGMRRGEAAGLRWQWVDLKTGLITLPATAHKGGHRTGKPRIIALPSAAQAIIARQPAGSPDDFVFKPAKGAGPLALAKPWVDVRREAGLPDGIGLHGLRHSIGTHLAMAGASAVELMQTLGHKQITTTLRYVHFAESARSTLAERAASVAVAGLEGMPAGEVIRLKK